MIKDVVPMFPKSDQAELIEAANLWRFPFWDWAAKRVTGSGPPNYDVPKLVREQEVEVRVAGGTARVPNPFYAFRMKDDIAMGDPKLAPDVVTREPVSHFIIHLMAWLDLINGSIPVPKQQVAIHMKTELRKIRPTVPKKMRTELLIMMASRTIFKRGNMKAEEILRGLYETGSTASY